MRKTRAVILCEDRAHYHFIRAYLVARGWNSRHLTPRVSPSGRGAASQWVCNHFADELTAYRRNIRENICLVVMIDGDNRKTTERFLELEANTTKQGISFRRMDERVAIFVPCRNLETWFAWLDGKDVDEITNYKKNYLRGTGRKLFGQRLAKQCLQDDRLVNTPDSLKAACREWSRIGA